MQHVRHCTALHCTALHCTALHCTALHWTALHCTALHCTALHCNALHCTALHCTALHCTALQCTAMHCTELQCTAMLCNALQCTVQYWNALYCTVMPQCTLWPALHCSTLYCMRCSSVQWYCSDGFHRLEGRQHLKRPKIIGKLINVTSAAQSPQRHFWSLYFNLIDSATCCSSLNYCATIGSRKYLWRLITLQSWLEYVWKWSLITRLPRLV